MTVAAVPPKKKRGTSYRTRSFKSGMVVQLYSNIVNCEFSTSHIVTTCITKRAKNGVKKNHWFVFYTKDISPSNVNDILHDCFRRARCKFTLDRSTLFYNVHSVKDNVITHELITRHSSGHNYDDALYRLNNKVRKND